LGIGEAGWRAIAVRREYAPDVLPIDHQIKVERC